MPRRRHRPLPEPRILQDAYLEYLRLHRGLSAVSQRQHRRSVADFLQFLEAQPVTLAELTVAHLDRYLASVASRGLSKSYLSVKQGGLQGFLRFLYAERHLPRDLARFVARPLRYREATVPPHFRWDEFRQLLASLRGDDALARRDRALLALLCVYGLRSQEVAQLTLDDVDWTHHTLRIEARKTNQPLVLPLVPVVAALLADYIRAARPADTGHRAVFLTRRGTPVPHGLWVTTRLQHLVARAGLAGGRGCHAIRRAVGTRLVEHGWGLGAVAQVLGHRSLASTRVYLRLSLEFLRDVADNYGELL